MAAVQLHHPPNQHSRVRKVRASVSVRVRVCVRVRVRVRMDGGNGGWGTRGCVRWPCVGAAAALTPPQTGNSSVAADSPHKHTRSGCAHLAQTFLGMLMTQG